MSKSKGVLLVAVGHPYYGKMAAQLAVSLKFTAPELSITLAHDGGAISHLSESDKSYFDNLINVPKEYYQRFGMNEYIKVKCHLYDLSPYKETIYLDVDMVWCPNKSINYLFEDLKDVNFTIQCRGYQDMKEPKEDYSWWVNLQELKQHYKIEEGKYYSYSSEFIYFKKCKEVETYFKKAVKNYDNLGVNYTMFGGGIPDELIFGLTSIQTGLYPHKDYFVPIYWEQAERKSLKNKDICSMFYAYSIGGAAQSTREQKTYNDFVQYYANRVGMANTWKAKNKREWQPQRQRL